MLGKKPESVLLIDPNGQCLAPNTQHIDQGIHDCRGTATQYTNYEFDYSKTSVNRPTMEPTLDGPFREVVSLGS